MILGAKGRWKRQRLGIVQSHLTRIIEDISKSGGESVPFAMGRAVQAMLAGDWLAALDLLAGAKARRRPTEGLDALRALCFLRRNSIDEACEALREEIRFFPANGDAKELLARILREKPRGLSERIGDVEFRGLLGVVRPYTMLGEERLLSLYSLAREVCEADVPGNFVECGVAGGGSSALLAHAIRRFSRRARVLFACDSFEGMPAPTAFDVQGNTRADDTGWGTGTCAAPEASVREICAALGVEDIIRTVKGYFRDTLPAVRHEVGPVALLHMDADWYESTLEILDNLYDNVACGGIIQLDDYGYWEGCRKALHEFEARRGIVFCLNRIDGIGVWFTKPPDGTAGAP
jgi:predicted O-methyltransferase YrrM